MKMQNITLEKIHEDMIELKKEVNHIKTMIEEEGSLSDEVIKEVEESRKQSKLISNKKMKSEFS